ncbi:MAG: FISUMP domain-containing protein, partial [Paludibacter sp.]
MKNLKSSHLFISSLLVLLLLSFKTFAFDYNIPFTATGASTAIDNIIVQNLTQGTSVTIPTGYSLSLSDVTSINQLVNNDKSLQIYPNPIQQKALVTFYSLQGGNTMINIFGIDGRNLVSLAKRLSIGLVQFQISLPKGVYTLQINESGIIHSAKIISQSNNRVKIQFLDAENTISKPIQKTKNSVIPFKYNNGDLLLFKATSGNYTTIQSDIISGNKEINFNFVECKDADGNYYPVVNIGSQVWMAENLKTSQYRNNTVITNKTTDTNWGTLTTEAYTDYNTPSKSSAYGKVYNWFVVNDSRTVAPIGWHIPTDAEWTTLTDFLGGIKPAGNKLKESGLTHWSSPNTGASNETGFTGLPGGARTTNIDIYDIGMQGYWWSSTVHSSNISAWYRCLDYLVSDVNRGSYPKTGGLSIRCIKGDFPALTTSSITDISATSAICGGNITNDGAVAITERGICWSTSTNPTITNNKTSDGSGSGVFSSTLTGLTIGTTYYVRAYATNNVGTSYGTQLSFSTILPSLTTSTATAITANSAT